MLDNLTDNLTAHEPTLDLLWKRVLFEVPFIPIWHTNIDTASFGSDDFYPLHALFREVDGSRVGRVDLNGRDRSCDLDFERWRGSDR